MRQAGRYMPEYRAVRARLGFLELCKNPEAAAEVTLQPVDRLGVDAAILFADITERPIEPGGLLARVAASGHGAQTLFLGVVRDQHKGKRVLGITYDCFAPLARKVLGDLPAQAFGLLVEFAAAGPHPY